MASSGNSKAFSGKTAGTYQYQLYYVMIMFGQVWQEGPATVAVTATVVGPATPNTPSGPTGTEYDGAYTISWNSVQYASTYRLQERLNGGTWSTIQNTSSLSKALSGKTPGTWSYRVRSENSVGVSGYSGIKNVTVAAPATPGTPSGPTGTEYDGAYTISWSAVTGATNYTLQERFNGGSWTTIQSSSATSRAISGKTPGTWQYHVRAESAAGNSSYSGTKSVTVAAPATPGTPSGPSTDYDGAYTVSWGSVTGAATYRLEERFNGGSWSMIQNTSSTSKALSGKTAGTWGYRVRAEAGAGNSSFSGIKNVVVSAPATPGTPSGPTGTEYDGAYTISGVQSRVRPTTRCRNVSMAGAGARFRAARPRARPSPARRRGRGSIRFGPRTRSATAATRPRRA